MGTATKAFGEYFHNLRIATGKTLRKFCLEHGLDPSNASKMERGLLVPPSETLERYAKCLGLKEGGNEWFTLLDLAAAARGEVPSDILSDEELLASLPVVFRTIRGEKLTPQQMDELIKMIREA
jgi:transcriptional regulator with XRE-family HTH domain